MMLTWIVNECVCMYGEALPVTYYIPLPWPVPGASCRDAHIVQHSGAVYALMCRLSSRSCCYSCAARSRPLGVSVVPALECSLLACCE
jgi:hypothetical protein